MGGEVVKTQTETKHNTISTVIGFDTKMTLPSPPHPPTTETQWYHSGGSYDGGFSAGWGVRRLVKNSSFFLTRPYTNFAFIFQHSKLNI